MRFINYLAYSIDDEKTNVFRSMNIKLVKKESNLMPIITKICQENLISENAILDLRKRLNGELKKTYSGKCLFDFCLDAGLPLEMIKTNKRLHDRLKIKILEANDELEKIKRKVENSLHSSHNSVK